MSDTPQDAIISTDTRRGQRIPPGQVLTRKWPVLHYGDVPEFDATTWNFAIFPRPFVADTISWTWDEFNKLPTTKVYADMHCVTRWSKLDNLWEGVATRELLKYITLSDEAKFVMVHCEYGFSTNVPVADFFAEDVLLATHHNGQALTPDHGYPLRLVVPRLYAWKSAKWVRGIEFLEEDRPGFWEQWAHGGYHMRGDPWVTAQGQSGERFRPR